MDKNPNFTNIQAPDMLNTNLKSKRKRKRSRFLAWIKERLCMHSFHLNESIIVLQKSHKSGVSQSPRNIKVKGTKMN